MRMRTFFESLDWQYLHQMTQQTDFQLSYKTPGDFATSVDLAIEDYLLGRIRAFDPQGQILSEEDSEKGQSSDQNSSPNQNPNQNQALQPDVNPVRQDRLWIVDPLDGTFNLALGMPYYGIQLCCQSLVTEQPLMALVYLPSLGELFYWDHLSAATECYQLTLTDQSVKLTPKKARPPVNAKLYSFGDFSKSNPSSRTLQARLMEALAPQVTKIRIHGSSSVDFAFLLSGRTQAHFIFSTRVWELQPGLALARGAGLHAVKYDLQTAVYTGPLWVIAQPSEIAVIERLISHLIT